MKLLPAHSHLQQCCPQHWNAMLPLGYSSYKLQGYCDLVILLPRIMSKNAADFIILDLPGPISFCCDFSASGLHHISHLDGGFGHLAFNHFNTFS